MKKILTLTFFLIIFACSNDDDLLIPAELDNPSVMIVFCQAEGDDTLRIVEYEYENDNLIKETSIQNGKVQNEISFEYNSDNQLISEISQSYWNKTERTYVYNDNNQLINVLNKYTVYDNNGQITNESESEAPREYENNKLVKEWGYWGGLITYEYNGDKVEKKIDYTKDGKKNHITTYKYSDSILIEEKKETSAGGLIYFKTFRYDSENRLIQIRDGENIIEINEYNGKRLIEKRQFYFGIDPCYAVCCGNYLYRFEY